MLCGGFKALQRNIDRFVVTNQRVFRVHGLLNRKEATMPLSRILDISVDKPIQGRILGYGHFTFESAAQEQGLRVIRYVGRPDERNLTIQRVVTPRRACAAEQPERPAWSNSSPRSSSPAAACRSPRIASRRPTARDARGVDAVLLVLDGYDDLEVALDLRLRPRGAYDDPPVVGQPEPQPDRRWDVARSPSERSSTCSTASPPSEVGRLVAQPVDHGRDRREVVHPHRELVGGVQAVGAGEVVEQVTQRAAGRLRPGRDVADQHQRARRRPCPSRASGSTQ